LAAKFLCHTYIGIRDILLYLRETNPLILFAMKTRMFLSFLMIVSLICFTNSCEMLGSEKTDDECSSNRWVAHKTGELLVNGGTMWIMSVADLNGAIPNADKNCHAQMTLEFWFKDKTLAKTTVKPPLSIVFLEVAGFLTLGRLPPM
jgi:hypothetical protein